MRGRMNSITSYFYSRPREGGDVALPLLKPGMTHISTHAPARGATKRRQKE